MKRFENQIMKFVLKFVAIAVLVALACIAGYASGVSCPVHSGASCYDAGQFKTINGQNFRLYRCSCGDAYWVPE